MSKLQDNQKHFLRSLARDAGPDGWIGPLDERTARASGRLTEEGKHVVEAMKWL